MTQGRREAETAGWRSRAGILSTGCMLLLLCSFNGRQASHDESAEPLRRHGFDIASAGIPADEIIELSAERDPVTALVNPPAVDIESLAERNFDLTTAGQGSFLADGDRVVGIVIEGEARAWSLKMLARHQLVNDQLGTGAVLVSYCPYSEGVAAFDRRVGNTVQEFAVSGLIYNSNMLMYSGTQAGESLWSQLLGRAVSGPQAGQALRMLPAQLVSWECWRNAHPDTTICLPDTGLDYSVDPYADLYPDIAHSYPPLPFEQPVEYRELIWPVEPQLPSESPLALRESIVAIGNEHGWTVFPLRALRSQLGSSSWLAVEGVRFELCKPGADQEQAGILVIPNDPARTQLAYAFWFAWYGMHPDSRIFPLPGI